MRRFSLPIYLLPIIVVGQTVNNNQLPVKDSIHFETKLSWEQIQTKARNENKLVFMDCFATWCAPCRYMSEKVFTQKEVADFMNSNFICVAVQMDKTTKDPPEIRKWYSDASEIASKYSINAFPTYLFFSPDGQPIHRFVGECTADDFVAKVKNAIDPRTQSYTLIKKSYLHMNDSSYLRTALMASLDAGDTLNVKILSDRYINCVQNLFTKDNLNLISRAIRSSNDSGFAIFLKYSHEIDSVLQSTESAENVVFRILAAEYLVPLFNKDVYPIAWKNLEGELMIRFPSLKKVILAELYSEFEYQLVRKEIRIPLYKEGSIPNWNDIQTVITERYPGYNPSEMIMKEKPRYYAYKKMWPQCEQAVSNLLDTYGKNIDNNELNSICWEYVFMHSSNRKILLKALTWSQRIIADSADSEAYKEAYPYMDTYANLLYKLGNVEKAIFWEKRALQLAEQSPFKSTAISFGITVKKMEKGESTWEGRGGKFEEYQ